MATLAQVLEDAEGCRAVVASMLLLELPDELMEDLVACDGQLSTLVAVVRRHLGVGLGVDRGRQAALSLGSLGGQPQQERASTKHLPATSDEAQRDVHRHRWRAANAEQQRQGRLDTPVSQPR